MAGAAGLTSLGTEYKRNAHNEGLRLKKRPACRRQYLVESQCGHGNRFWWAKNCGSWRCQACTAWRIEVEIEPEIQQAMDWARERGETLKFITVTWQAQDEGAQPNDAGQRRRKLDRQHLIQAIRRDRGEFFEYMRVPEQHKSGKVHEHWLGVTGYLDENQLQEQWRKHTRGSSFNVKVNAVAMPCPLCWPGRGASRDRKNKSRIVPPPGKGCCEWCGYRPDWGTPGPWGDVKHHVAVEMAKYLVKTAAAGFTRKLLSRSKGWQERCRVDDECEPAGELESCAECGVVHSWRFLGIVEKLVHTRLEARLVLEEGRVYQYGVDGPCYCWSEVGERAGPEWNPWVPLLPISSVVTFPRDSRR